MIIEKKHFSVTLDNEIFEKIENFRFKNGFTTRNQAIIELLRLGLETAKNQPNNGYWKYKF